MMNGVHLLRQYGENANVGNEFSFYKCVYRSLNLLLPSNPNKLERILLT